MEKFDLIQTAEWLLNEGINVLGVNRDKRPVRKWEQLQRVLSGIDYATEMLTKAHGLAVITGKISGNLECIDFDAHNNNIDAIFEEFSNDDGVADIMRRRRVYVESTPKGGYHIIYRYESTVETTGSQVLARWENGQSMIETRGEGAYVIVAPTEGYKAIRGNLTQIDELTAEERNYLVNYCLTFDRKPKKSELQNNEANFDNTDPVSWFNWYKSDYAKMLLIDKGWTVVNTDESGVQYWRRPGKEDGVSATWNYKQNAFYMFTTSWPELKPNVYYTPFQLLVKLRFKGDYMAALHWILNKYFDPSAAMPYIRVGTDYYKRISKVDRFGIQRIELKPWKKEEIKQDHGKQIFDNIPKFDDFEIEPNNIEHTPVIRNCYNLYREFPHKPEPGQWKWSRILLEHVFGEQFDLGLRYMQALYLHPKRMLPILVLVSKERQTGKTTFINWLNIIFGPNMVNINPEDLTSSFNASYATANLIAVEETLIEKSVTVEKLKALATGKFLSVNQKFVNAYKIPFYGKIILASNNEDKFARIDEEEVRFWVRKLNVPTIKNHDIETDLAKEVPAFLHYLTTLPPIDWTRDRSGFTPAELLNETLQRVKQESKSTLYKELTHYFTDLFLNHPNESKVILATPTDIKQRWYRNNPRIDVAYISNVLKNEFKFLTTGKSVRYIPFDLPYSHDGILNEKKVGTPYIIDVNHFVNDSIDFDFHF